MCEERATQHRAGHDLRRTHDVLGQDVDEVLRQPPDEGWLPEDPVWIQVHAAVKAVAVVEMPVEHQHARLLQMLERLPAQIVTPAHASLGPPDLRSRTTRVLPRWWRPQRP